MGDVGTFNMDSLVGGGSGSDSGNAGSSGGPADVANMDLTVPGGEDVNMPSNVDAKIDALFDLGSADMDSMDMDYNLGSDTGGDNSNFNNMYYPGGDDNDNIGGPGFDDTYFVL